ncbi:hypothetical protein Lal_00047490 [Lupinus albus]|nr:hypothetical protein Lal_00047490 [Lupinus albus]
MAFTLSTHSMIALSLFGGFAHLSPHDLSTILNFHYTQRETLNSVTLLRTDVHDDFHSIDTDQMITLYLFSGCTQ